LDLFIFILINIVNENDYQYHNAADNTLKKCIGAKEIYVYAWL